MSHSLQPLVGSPLKRAFTTNFPPHFCTKRRKMTVRERERRGRAGRMWCQSCREDYEEPDAGTCKECYEKASETEEELKREIEDLFLRLNFPPESSATDVLFFAAASSSPAVPAPRAVLISRPRVFKAMLDNEMEESRSGMIKICDVSYDIIRCFVPYLYTAEVLLDEQMANGLLVMGEKYQVKHLKTFCEKFITSKVNIDNAIVSYAFAHRHNAKQLLDAALSLIMDNMATLTESEESTRSWWKGSKTGGRDL